VRWTVGLVMTLVTTNAHAAPTTLTGDVHYDFMDQNGFGWATVAGTVSVTVTFTGKDDGTLTIKGTRSSVDGQLVAGPTPTSSPDMKATRSETTVDTSFPLHEVAFAKGTITFKLDPVHDHLEGSCAPMTTKLAGVASTTLYECTITGFQWHTIANLPELHHPIVLNANVKAKTRILNTMSGAAKAGFGKRAVTERTPAKKTAAR
jgi:hypothetical protein